MASTGQDKKDPARPAVKKSGEEQKSSGDEKAAEPKTMDWLTDSPEWGTRAKPGKKGLTLDDINVGLYGQIPDQSEEMTRMPRGARHVPGLPRLEFYPLSKKVDVWADNAPALYEEAIQRRWMAHLDIPWDSVEPLPREVELSLCQLSTELAQQATIETDSIGQWIGRINYAYYEVKTFWPPNSTTPPGITTCSGLGPWPTEERWDWRVLVSSTGASSRAGPAGRKPPSLCTCSGDRSPSCSIDMAKPMPRIPRTRRFSGCASRIRPGTWPTGWPTLDTQSRRRAPTPRMMSGVERDMGSEMKDPVLWEALAIIFGGGLEYISAGMDVVHSLQRRYITEYMARMQWAGIDKTLENLEPSLKVFLEQEATQESGAPA